MLPMLGERVGRFGPRQLPGLRLWLAADRIGGLADGAAVATWRDLSGRGHDAAQGAPLWQPTYRVAVVNGRPVVRFGANQGLSLGGAGLGVLRNVAGTTCFAVLQTTKPGAGRFIFMASVGGSAAAARYGMAREYAAAGVLEVRGRRLDGDAVQSVNGGAFDAGEWCVQAALVDYSAQRARVYKNGVQVAASDAFQTAGNTSDTDSAAVNVAGPGGGGIEGDLAELLLYARALGEGERRRVERYLGWKYGLGVA